MDKKKPDTIRVNDATGRRTFVRAGAAFLLAGSSIAQSQEQPFRTDCDSQGFAGQKNPQVAGNDSDSGSSADRPGCGRREPPAMSEYKKNGDGTVRVVRVKG